MEHTQSYAHVYIVQGAQYLILAFILIALVIVAARMIVKIKVHREVYGKGFKSYFEAKLLEKQHQINKNREVDTKK